MALETLIADYDEATGHPARPRSSAFPPVCVISAIARKSPHLRLQPRIRVQLPHPVHVHVQQQNQARLVMAGPTPRAQSVPRSIAARQLGRLRRLTALRTGLFLHRGFLGFSPENLGAGAHVEHQKTGPSRLEHTAPMSAPGARVWSVVGIGARGSSSTVRSRLRRAGIAVVNLQPVVAAADDAHPVAAVHLLAEAAPRPAARDLSSARFHACHAAARVRTVAVVAPAPLAVEGNDACCRRAQVLLMMLGKGWRIAQATKSWASPRKFISAQSLPCSEDGSDSRAAANGLLTGC